jgi:hypothetical protein
LAAQNTAVAPTATPAATGTPIRRSFALEESGEMRGLHCNREAFLKKKVIAKGPAKYFYFKNLEQRLH